MVFSRKSICVKSSRLMIAPNLSAYANSSAGVSLEENIMCFPSNPQDLESISSVYEEQSHPISYSCKWLAYLHFAIYATTTILQIQAIFGFYFKFINRYVKIVALHIVYYTKDEFI